MNCPNSDYLQDVAVKAGEIIRKNFKLGMKKEWKEDGSPLTATDIAVNDLVLFSFFRDFPHIMVISEEGDRDVLGSEYKVYCDPLDGTMPFCMGIPISTFCISVVSDDKPITAVIYDPFNERMWHATQGQGAFLGKTRIWVSRHVEINHSKIFIEWAEKYNFRSVYEKLTDAGARCMNVPSIAYFGGLVASGEMEATFHHGPRPWEAIAMQLLVEEAGGKSTDLFGNPIKFKANSDVLSYGHLISNGEIHDELLKFISESQKTP
jgi:myo-inositol-1(or 4)-monophosphatase